MLRERQCLSKVKTKVIIELMCFTIALPMACVTVLEEKHKIYSQIRATAD